MGNDIKELANYVEALAGRDHAANEAISRHFGSCGTVRPYTECLRTAIDLVPSGYCPGVSQSAWTGMWHAWVGAIVNDEPVCMGKADALTAPLALVAASLRAHSYLEEA